MLNVCECPAPESLQAFARGEIDSDEIDRHVDGCASCKRLVETLNGGPTSLVRLLRPVPSTEDDADLERLTTRAKALAEPVEERLGDYELLEPIARGGMGWVYKARHRHLNRVVALKTIAPDLSRQQEATARFRREVEALAALSHPHIVAAHDAFEDAGRHYLVMEYVDGCSLDQLVRRNGPLPVAQALDYVLQAAHGLEHAHAAGLVHRDVKPGNLLLDSSNTVKLLDLGLARWSHAENNGAGEHLTGGSVVMGTAAYMAPEQALDPRRADARADIYSLGCTLYFLLTGRPPHESDSVLKTLLAHRDEPIPSLIAARPDCPPALDATFRRMLARRPENRPASMAAIIADLERIRDGKVASPTRRRWVAAGVLTAALLLLALFLPRGDKAQDDRPDPDPSPAPAPAPKPMAEKRERTPRIEMVRVEPGKFWMGSGENDRDALADERPRHEVRITRGFLLGKFEVTQEQYQEVTGSNPSAFRSKGKSGKMVEGVDTSKHPVDSVSWEDAVAFCNRLSELHGLEPYYRIEKTRVTVRGGTGYRLPTEAEWEYAARAGSASRWASGDDEKALDEFAWHAGNSDEHTHPVGTKKPNAWGLFDMHGNVPEHCWDRYDKQYYQKSPAIDPPGAGSGSTRVYRGGGWNSLPSGTRSAARNTVGTAYSVLTVVGIRVARDLP